MPDQRLLRDSMALPKCTGSKISMYTVQNVQGHVSDHCLSRSTFTIWYIERPLNLFERKWLMWEGNTSVGHNLCGVPYSTLVIPLLIPSKTKVRTFSAACTSGLPTILKSSMKTYCTQTSITESPDALNQRVYITFSKGWCFGSNIQALKVENTATQG